MLMHSPAYKRVASASYVTVQIRGQPMDMLRVELAEHDAAVEVPNGNFSTDNAALWVLAHMGISPSTLDEAAGCMIHVVEVEPNTFRVSELAVRHGKRQLLDADWCPAFDDETAARVPSGAVTAVAPSDGGGDPAA